MKGEIGNESSPAPYVAIGASAGGIEIIMELLGALPTQWDRALVIIQHLDRSSRRLCDIFAKRCVLPVVEALDEMAWNPGSVYLAPTDYHLLLNSNRTFALSVDPPVKYSRPSIDVFFESAAEVLREELAGMILTGANSDGAQGLKTIVQYRGCGVVQNPTTAAYETMPRTALEVCPNSLVLDLDGLKKTLGQVRGSDAAN